MAKRKDNKLYEIKKVECKFELLESKSVYSDLYNLIPKKSIKTNENLIDIKRAIESEIFKFIYSEDLLINLKKFSKEDIKAYKDIVGVIRKLPKQLRPDIQLEKKIYSDLRRYEDNNFINDENLDERISLDYYNLVAYSTILDVENINKRYEFLEKRLKNNNIEIDTYNYMLKFSNYFLNKSEKLKQKRSKNKELYEFYLDFAKKIYDKARKEKNLSIEIIEKKNTNIFFTEISKKIIKAFNKLKELGSKIKKEENFEVVDLSDKESIEKFIKAFFPPSIGNKEREKIDVIAEFMWEVLDKEFEEKGKASVSDYLAEDFGIVKDYSKKYNQLKSGPLYLKLYDMMSRKFIERDKYSTDIDEAIESEIFKFIYSEDLLINLKKFSKEDIKAYKDIVGVIRKLPKQLRPDIQLEKKIYNDLRRYEDGSSIKKQILSKKIYWNYYRLIAYSTILDVENINKRYEFLEKRLKNNNIGIDTYKSILIFSNEFLNRFEDLGEKSKENKELYEFYLNSAKKIYNKTRKEKKLQTNFIETEKTNKFFRKKVMGKGRKVNISNEDTYNFLTENIFQPIIDRQRNKREKDKVNELGEFWYRILKEQNLEKEKNNKMKEELSKQVKERRVKVISFKKNKDDGRNI